jgi:hypothetical protein
MKMKVIKISYLMSTISAISILSSAIPASSQQSEIVTKNHVYRLLDAHSACVTLYAGQTIGAITITDAWHSPDADPSNRNTCKFSYVTTWQNNAGWNAGTKAGVNAGVANGEVNAGVNGSHSDNGNTEVQYGTRPIDKNRACLQQQGTPKAVLTRSGKYIYCRHNR